MLPYCRRAPAAITVPAVTGSWRTLTFSRSSSVIFNAGLSSVFAIGSLSGIWRGFRLLLRLGWLGVLPLAACPRCLWAGSPIQGWSGPQEPLHTDAHHRFLKYGFIVLKSLLHRANVRSQTPSQVLMAQRKADEQHRNVSQNPAGPLDPLRLAGALS